MERIKVYYPSTMNDSKYSTRTIEQGQEFPKNCYYTIEEAVNAQKERERKALEHHLKHQEEAEKKLDAIEEDILAVLGKHKASLYFTYEGDSHGIYDEGLEISVSVEGDEYTRELNL